MPMFDFLCPKCQHKFEELVFGDERQFVRNAAKKTLKDW